MKISTRVECGIIALIDIAINSENGTAISTVGISERQKISAKYLEQILIALKQANLIRGQKGSRGGYVLSRPAETITFQEIISALDVTILCESHPDDLPDGSDFRSTINSCLWDKMTAYLNSFTQGITLAQVAEMCKKSQNDNTEYMYYI